MSFILDALKKSESDRQRQSGPSLFEVKVAPPRRTLPIWAVAIAVLLGVNVIVVSWMLLRRPPAPQPAAAAVTAAPNAAPPPAVSAAAARPAANTAQRAPASAAPAASSAPLPAAAPSESSASVGEPPAAAPHSPSAGAGAAADQSSSPPAAGGDPSDYAPAVEPGGTHASGVTQEAGGALPLYQQIVDSAGLPPLHLDLHVYADRPRDRFVMINMHRVGEGDSLPGGVAVETIRPDGVVLTYHGTRFLLPRN